MTENNKQHHCSWILQNTIIKLKKWRGTFTAHIFHWRIYFYFLVSDWKKTQKLFNHQASIEQQRRISTHTKDTYLRVHQLNAIRNVYKTANRRYGYWIRYQIVSNRIFWRNGMYSMCATCNRIFFRSFFICMHACICIYVYSISIVLQMENERFEITFLEFLVFIEFVVVKHLYLVYIVLILFDSFCHIGFREKMIAKEKCERSKRTERKGDNFFLSLFLFFTHSHRSHLTKQ